MIFSHDVTTLLLAVIAKNRAGGEAYNVACVSDCGAIEDTCNMYRLERIADNRRVHSNHWQAFVDR